MKIETELRPCLVNDKRALFHKWSDKSQIVEPSPFIGGDQGGVLMYTVGIIEYEDGQICECMPSQIKFIDSKIEQYHFID
jgi:hypothetical protein